jgi:hypothetical protein
MKKLTIFILLLNFSNVFSQQQDIIPVVESKMIFSKIVEVDSANKDELYLRAKVWIAEAFKSPTNVVQLDDKASGQILIKGIIYSWMSGKQHTVYSTLKIYLKENKAMLEITDFIINDGSTDFNLEAWETNQKRLKGCLESVKEESTKLTESFAKSIIKGQKKNW